MLSTTHLKDLFRCVDFLTLQVCPAPLPLTQSPGSGWLALPGWLSAQKTRPAVMRPHMCLVVVQGGGGAAAPVGARILLPPLPRVLTRACPSPAAPCFAFLAFCWNHRVLRFQSDREGGLQLCARCRKGPCVCQSGGVTVIPCALVFGGVRWPEPFCGHGGVG